MKGNTDAEAAGPAFHERKYNADTNKLCGIAVPVENKQFDCAACGSDLFVSRGEVRKGERFECLDCGAAVDVLGGGSE